MFLSCVGTHVFWSQPETNKERPNLGGSPKDTHTHTLTHAQIILFFSAEGYGVDRPRSDLWFWGQLSGRGPEIWLQEILGLSGIPPGFFWEGHFKSQLPEKWFVFLQECRHTRQGKGKFMPFEAQPEMSRPNEVRQLPSRISADAHSARLL